MASKCASDCVAGHVDYGPVVVTAHGQRAVIVRSLHDCVVRDCALVLPASAETVIGQAFALQPYAAAGDSAMVAKFVSE